MGLFGDGYGINVVDVAILKELRERVNPVLNVAEHNRKTVCPGIPVYFFMRLHMNMGARHFCSVWISVISATYIYAKKP